MKVEITRNMVVASDEGEAISFKKGQTDKGRDDGLTVSESVGRRLIRAAAANPLPNDEAEDAPEVVNLDRMNKVALAEYADANGITLAEGMTKAEIIEHIRATSAA